MKKSFSKFVSILFVSFLISACEQTGKSSFTNDSLESKTEKGVHFLGELLDYDGPCGGHNIMWAIASALYLSTSF